MTQELPSIPAIPEAITRVIASTLTDLALPLIVSAGDLLREIATFESTTVSGRV